MITLTNGVQIPENAVQLQTTAAIDGYYVTQPFRLVQYDETLPVAAVQLTYQNQPYTPPTGAELNVRMGKPDGTTVYNPCLGMDSSGIVYFAFTQQMTIVAGTGTLTVEITDSGVKNSAPIIAEIRPNPVPEGSIESADEFLTLQEILQQAKKWGQIVQANASNIRQVVDNLADIQNAAENAQAAAASAAAAQQAAQEALGFRTFFSAVRPDSNGNLDPSRPMTVGPAASVEIESAGDRIQSVTALGFTQQAGTGDPSPSNVRQLTNGGLKLVKLVLTGSEEGLTHSGGLLKYTVSVPGQRGTHPYAGYIQSQSPYSSGNANGIYLWSETSLEIKHPAFTSLQAAKTYLQANPLPVWYAPADEADATGLYAPIILQGGEYRATCLPLTAPLCEGDSVVSWVKSGCDKVLVLDGSEDEGWILNSGAGTGGSGSKRFTLEFSEQVANTNSATASTAFSSYAQNVSVNVTFTGSTENVFAVLYVQSSSKSKLYLRLSGISTVEALREYLAAHPLTVWYRSTNYTKKNDIPVSLETHQKAALVLDESTRFVTDPAGSGNGLCYCNLLQSPKAYSAYQAERFVQKDSTAAGGAYLSGALKINPTGGQFADLGATVDDAATKLNEYFTANPTKIVYQLATPITYAHEAVVLEAATGDQLTYTVTGQSGGTVSVALKPFQDGGHAATADNATNAQNADNATNAQNADNATQFDGLTLSALKNLLVPVGYIFSWAPTSGGPDLSTPAKVAAYFGFGAWQAYGTGRVLVGVASGQTEFATVGQTGGEKTHTLLVSEMPAHSHGPKEGSSFVCISDTPTDRGITGSSIYNYTTHGANNVTTQRGDGQAHNNLQPYITVYRWQRVA